MIEANSDEVASSGSSSEYSAESLVGREIHRYNVEGEEQWYAGHVVSYNAVTHLHEVGEEENSFFNLLIMVTLF